MVKHIVIWKLPEENKKENALFLKEKLEALNGQIPGMIKLELGVDFSKMDISGDIVLYSEFETKEALDAYQVNPLHKEAAKYVRELAVERRIVDYEK